MRISHIHIENFRNFHVFDVEVGVHAVIVGENKIGKSNLLHALRLVLDPSLPDSARQLRNEDFWDGLERPLDKKDIITISVDFADFEEDERLVAILGEHLISTEPMVARLTYIFAPLKATDHDDITEADYEFVIFGGDRPENKVGFEVRRRLPLYLLPALRDAEGDLSNWRKSPLRPLLDEASTTIHHDTLEEIAKEISQVTSKVSEIDQIDDLAASITDRLTEMVGTSHALEMTLGFSPTSPERLLRSLRLFIDNGRRGIGEASLGSANLLYLTLTALELEQLVEQRSRDHTFLAIEEPEAHLHPQVQRLVFRDLLQPRAHQHTEPDQTNEPETKTVFLTTHSPHIVSVSPLQSLIVLKEMRDEQSTIGSSTAGLQIEDKDREDLERYLDVTRGEILFAKGILLVEGDAEVFLIPALAKLNGYDLDQLGISICSVSGTNFLPYVKFIGAAGLNIPFAVLTDRDPQENGPALGDSRAAKILQEINPKIKTKSDEITEAAAKHGIFLNDHTFEIDLFACGRHKSMSRTLLELSENAACHERAKKWATNPKSMEPDQLLKDISQIGKGRFAQRLATNISKEFCPTYIKEAIEYVLSQLK